MVFRQRLSAETRKKYSSDFSVLLDAASCGNFNAWSVSQEEACFAALFFVLSRSIHSLPGFLSACSKCYEEAGLSFPKGPIIKGFCDGLSHLFHSVDKVSQAYSLSSSEISAMLKQLNQSLFEDVVFACWMLLSFFGAMRPQDYKLSRLTWRDVTLSEDGVDVVLRPTKGIKGHGPFTFSVPRVSGNWLNLPSWLELLQSLLIFRNPTFPIFGRRKLREKPFSSSWFVSKLRRIFAATFGAAPLGQPLTAYSLRRGFATEASRSGSSDGEISKALRHKNVDTTRRYIAELESRNLRLQISRRAMNHRL
jgi:integrase